MYKDFKKESKYILATAPNPLNKERKLSLDMIRKISKKMHISTDVLIQEY